MKQSLFFIPLALLIATTAHAADDTVEKKKTPAECYKNSEFKEPIAGFRDLIEQGIDVQSNRCMLAQCQAAQALEYINNKVVDGIPYTQDDQVAFNNAINELAQSNPHYRFIKNAQKVILFNEGFGDTIQFMRDALTKNELRKNKGKSELIFHLGGAQALLKNIVQRAGAVNITTGDISQHSDKSIIPLIKVAKKRKLFNAHQQPYLAPKPEAVEHVNNLLDEHARRGNDGDIFAVACRSGKVAVLGGKILERDLDPVQILKIIHKTSKNPRIFFVQGQPHHNIFSQSLFDAMSQEDKAIHKDSIVVPDKYYKSIIQVTQPNGREPNGPFDTTLAVLARKDVTYVGPDTVLPHIAGNAGARTIMILPPAKDGNNPRDWRWMEGMQRPTADKSLLGESTAWYPEKLFRLFQTDLSTKEGRRPIKEQLKLWCAAQKALQS